MPQLYFKAPNIDPVWRLVQLFINHKKRPQDYHIALKEWVIFLGGKPGTKKSAKLITKASLEDALSYMEFQKLQPGIKSTQLFHDRDELRSNATIAKRVDILKHLYNMLMSQGMVVSNPFAMVSKPPSQSMQKQPTQIIGLEFVNKIIDKCPNSPKGLQHRAVIACLFGAALRRSECSKLLIGDVKRGPSGFYYLFLRDTKTRNDYNQECQEDMMSHVLRWKEKRLSYGAKENYHLWCTLKDLEAGSKGKALFPRTVSRILQRYTSAAGVEHHVSAHSARATVATAMLDAGIAIEVVAKFLRHSSIESTRKYDKRRLEGLKSPARKLSFNIDE